MKDYGKIGKPKTKEQKMNEGYEFKATSQRNKIKKQETIADIIAEMRGIRVREFQDYAERFEAALWRERVELVGGGTVTVGGGSAADVPRTAAPRARAKRFKTRFRIKG